MAVTCSGVIRDPSDNPVPNLRILIRAIGTNLTSLDGSEVVVTTDADGAYSFPLEIGRYGVFMDYGNETFVGEIVITDKTVDDTLNQYLINVDFISVVGEALAEFEKLRNEARQAVVDADAQADRATEQVALAAQQVDLATNEVVKATAQADRAKAEADRASQVTGLDTVEQAVEEALDQFAGMMTESQARAIQKQNEQKFTASGFVDMGSHYNSATDTSVNEGMTVMSNIPNTIGLGRGGAYGPQGSSKTNFPVTHIAGAVSKLYGFTRSVGGNPLVRSEILLPQAPDGTVIYDSTGDCRGSGKANLDLKVDVDPKYGNVPTGTAEEIQREATSRAFEGEVKNGDFRLGANGDWTTEGSSRVVIGQLIVPATSAGRIRVDGFAGVECLMRCYVTGGTGEFQLRNSSNNASQGAVSVSSNGELELRVTPSENGWVRLFCDSGEMVVTNVSFKPVTEEVVTHPVDLSMLEYYEEEITTNRIEIMECIQSLSSTFGTTSVPTVLSTRPLSYFQQYDGQFDDPNMQNDRYRCVVWNDLTPKQRREIAAYMGERLFRGENGFPVNGRLRARTIRGMGNGDWTMIATNLNDTSLCYENIRNALVMPQGRKDVVPVGNYNANYRNPTRSSLAVKSTGVWTQHESSGERYAYKGRCFAYVVATVPRANQGAYHPDLNPWGCRKFNENTGGWGNWDWYSSAVDTSNYTTKDCFIIGSGNPAEGADHGAYNNSGAIGQPSGHPDGILYDGIEAGGLNGVIDWRLTCYEESSKEEASKVAGQVLARNYRGLEKLVKFGKNQYSENGGTRFYYAGTTTVNFYSYEFKTQVDSGAIKRGEHVWAVSKNGVDIFTATVKGATNGAGYSVLENAALVAGTLPVSGTSLSVDDWDMWCIKEVNLSVSGEFSTQMVIANPANFIATFPNGILGTWCSVIPDGSISLFPVSRKYMGGGTRLYSTDIGKTWSAQSGVSPGGATNEISYNVASNGAYILNYKAFAKQVKVSNVQSVFNAAEGLLGVVTTQDYSEGVLSEALADIILTSNASSITSEQSNPIKFMVNDAISRLKTELTDMVAPANNSKAIKAAVYQVSINGQMYLGFITNTMSHNGTSWGEKQELQIPSSGKPFGTFPDANGVTQYMQSTITAIPHGWANNRARAGTQTKGVDL